MTSDDLSEIQANLESIERAFWLYGVPLVLLTWLLVGVLIGMGLCRWLA